MIWKDLSRNGSMETSDGSALFAAAHTIPEFTWEGIIKQAIAIGDEHEFFLSESALAAMKEIFTGFVDENANLIPTRPMTP